MTLRPTALLLSMMLFPGISQAGEAIDKTLDITKDGTIIIEAMRGEVDIKSWDKAQISISGELDDDAEGYIFKTEGSVTTFQVEMPERERYYDNGKNEDGSKLKIFVPVNSEIDFTGVATDISITTIKGGSKVSTVNGTIKASKLMNRIQLNTVNGRIELSDSQGKIALETVNGEVIDKNSDGKISLTTVNGEIESNSRSNDIEVQNVNGEITLNLAQVEDLNINSVGGDIEVSLEAADNSDIEVSTVSGDIKMMFATVPNARFEIDSHMSGNIKNKLTDHKVHETKYGPGENLEFVSGKGNGDIEISTLSGDILLKKK